MSFLFGDIFIYRDSLFLHLHFLYQYFICIFDFKTIRYQLSSLNKQLLSQIQRTFMSDNYQEGVAITIIVLNALSLVSLCFVLGVYITNWKSISSFPMRLSFYLCLACLGQNATVIVLNPITVHQLEQQNHESTSSFCVFEGVMKVSFDLSSIIWTTLIIYSVYASVSQKRKLEKFQVVYILIGYALPLAVACIPIIFNAYDYNNYYCWFREDTTSLGFWLRMGYYFIPLWILFIANMAFALSTHRYLKTIQLSEDVLRVFNRLILFPFILFFTGIIATVDVIYTYSTKDQQYWLNYVGIFLLNLYGFFNSIAYGLNPIIRSRLALCCRRNSDSFAEQFQNIPDFRSSTNSQQIKAQLMQMSSIKKVVPLNPPPAA